MYLKQIRPSKRSTFDVGDKYGLSLLTRLCVDFSDLREHRFRHKWDCLSPICECKIENESTSHFLLRCPRHNNERDDLFSALSDIIKIDKVLLSSLNHVVLVDILLFGSKEYDDIRNKLIIESCIRFILSTGRFKNIEAYMI